MPLTVGLQERYRRHQWERWKLAEATWEDIEGLTEANPNPETADADAAEDAEDETKANAQPAK